MRDRVRDRALQLVRRAAVAVGVGHDERLADTRGGEVAEHDRRVERAREGVRGEVRRARVAAASRRWWRRARSCAGSPARRIRARARSARRSRTAAPRRSARRRRGGRRSRSGSRRWRPGAAAITVAASARRRSSARAPGDVHRESAARGAAQALRSCCATRRGQPFVAGAAGARSREFGGEPLRFASARRPSNASGASVECSGAGARSARTRRSPARSRTERTPRGRCVR